MRRFVALAVGLLALLVGPAPGMASHDPSGEPANQDFATGDYVLVGTQFTFGFDFAAQSGPQGGGATGDFFYELRFTNEPSLNNTIKGTVTCLRVQGNLASIGLAVTEPADRVGAIVGVADEPVGQPDLLYVLYTDAVPGPGECPAPVHPSTIEISNLFIITDERGGITVHDAGPTSKDQCKDGGWQNFPGFRNQGDCVSAAARNR